jgi:Flp pilus assembly pilin Flp
MRDVLTDLLSRHRGRLGRFFRRLDRRGQTLVEYALILAFISVVAISVLASLGQNVKATF